MKRDWLIENCAAGKRMTMLGPWSVAAEDAFLREGATGLYLNHAKGWRGKELSFLLRLKERITWLSIIDFLIEDTSEVNSLANLRSLDLNTYCRTPIDFLRFPLLTNCYLEWREGAASVFEHRGLKSLFINKLPDRDMSRVKRLIGLESLSLASPGLASLSGIESLAALQFLGIYVARRLTSLAGLEGLQRLTGLEITDCPKIGSLTPLASLRDLQELNVSNDGKIDSFAPLEGLDKLEWVLFTESTNVLDGDLSVLARLKSLKGVAFMERKHYSHRRVDLPSRIRAAVKYDS
jgi:hypothetical protein